jgi:branched-chain amino acid transport system substrate-binding protein
MRISNIIRLILGIVLALGWWGAPVSAQDAIVIGAATSLTTLEGNESVRAAALAVEEINRAGGVPVAARRLPLRLVKMDLADADIGTSQADSLQRLERFIDAKKMHAIVVGPFRSEVLLPAMDIIARHRIPILESIAMTPATEIMVLRDSRYRFAFRTGLNTKYLADALIRIMQFLNSRFGFTRVYIMSQDVAWARSTAATMIKLYFDRKGWQLVGADHFASGASDFSAALAKAKAGRAQVVVPIFDMPQSAVLAEQWKAMQVPAMLCGFISPMVGPGAWQALHGQIAGTLNVVFELGNVPAHRYPMASQFYRAYARRYGRPIEAGHGPAPAYEAVYLLAEAIRQADSLDPEKIVTALEASDRMGVMGRVRFQKGHQVIFGSDPATEAVACLIQWTRDGRRRIVYPPSIAEGEIEWPDGGRLGKP